MSSPNVRPQHRPSLQHAITTPPPRHLDLTFDELSSPGASGSDLKRRTSHRKRLRRGLTFEEVQSCGVINDHEKSAQFDDLPISAEEIKKLPKKLRGYYEHLAVLHDHYAEVDAILSGELPSAIASSFQPTRSYTHLRGDLAEEINPDIDDAPGWLRRGSAWKVKPTKRSSVKSGMNGSGGADPEMGEGTGLLSAEEKEDKRDKLARLALNVNTLVNVLLVAAKAVAVLYSSSISLTASLVDSALDLFSTFIILGTSWAIGLKTDRHMYPAGKRRFEPLGVLIFSVAMIASFIQVFIESFQRATGPKREEAGDLSRIGIATMLATIAIKGVLWVWCARIPSFGVQALAQDAENDVYFNIMSLAFPFVGTRLHWRLLDPIGGMVLSLYIIVEWLKTLAGNFANQIGDVECYHMGDDLIVEIDVILPQSSTLHFAHDVGETIQCVLESLDGVLRAYVHCDYSSSNPLQHTSRTPAPPSQQYPTPISGHPRKSSSNDSSGSATPTNKSTLSTRLGMNGHAGVSESPAEVEDVENGNGILGDQVK